MIAQRRRTRAGQRRPRRATRGQGPPPLPRCECECARLAWGVRARLAWGVRLGVTGVWLTSARCVWGAWRAWGCSVCTGVLGVHGGARCTLGGVAQWLGVARCGSVWLGVARCGSVCMGVLGVRGDARCAANLHPNPNPTGQGTHEGGGQGATENTQLLGTPRPHLGKRSRHRPHLPKRTRHTSDTSDTPPEAVTTHLGNLGHATVTTLRTRARATAARAAAATGV